MEAVPGAPCPRDLYWLLHSQFAYNAMQRWAKIRQLSQIVSTGQRELRSTAAFQTEPVPVFMWDVSVVSQSQSGPKPNKEHPDDGVLPISLPKPSLNDAAT